MANDGSPSKNVPTNNQNSDESDNEEPDRPQQLLLDLGDDSSRKFESNRLGISNNVAAGSSSSESQKREDNPFSFKHFLRDASSYQNKGARPKVYCEGRPVPTVQDITGEVKQNRMVPEFSSALPDFVQDHLVIEQCYLGNTTNPNYNLDMNNLPDFTPARENINRLKYDPSHNHHESDINIPLDLPVRPQAGFPLDLPITNAGSSRSSAEVGNSKSLPDFLADSALCSQQCDNLSSLNSPEGDGDSLRRELENLRRQLSDQIRRADNLNRELDLARSKENEYTHNLAKALEQVEENLEKSNRKCAAAMSTIQKLRQEIKSLNLQVHELRQENKMLRGDEASGGVGYYNSTNELHSQRLAQELRAAASTAEHSLRQLLTGVDNLRIMAASLENMHRIEEKQDPFLDKDEDSGPAL